MAIESTILSDPTRLNGASAQPMAGERANAKFPPLAAIKFAATLGQIVLVLMRTRQHRHAFLGDLEWLVVPAVATGQFILAEQRDATTGLAMPVAVALWAQVSEEVDARLSNTSDRRVRLKPEEWASGTIPWLVEASGETRAVGDLLRALVDQRFATTGLKTLGRSPDGRPGVRVLRKETADSAAPQEGSVQAEASA